MKDKRLKDIYQNLDWIADRLDDLSERINDYVFEAGVDIGLSEPDVKKLLEFDRECNELHARHNLEIKNLEKLLD